MSVISLGNDALVFFIGIIQYLFAAIISDFIEVVSGVVLCFQIKVLELLH
jgi:energy-converting hydrogenase Eha subunit C